MKNKRIQYNNGGSLKLFKNFNSLDASVSASVGKNNINFRAQKNFPTKGVSVGASVDKYGNKSSTTYNLNKQVNKNFNFGVSKTKGQSPTYGVTYKVKF